MAPGVPLQAEDRAWVEDSADALARLAAHAGDEALAARAGTLAAALAALPADASPDALALVRTHLDGVDAVGAPADAPVVLASLAGAARADAERAAAARGARVAIEVDVPPGVALPPAQAAALVDALGRVLRDAVAHGTPEGGAIRVFGHVEREDLVLVAGDRGVSGAAGDAGGPQLHPARVRGLHAAAGCLAAAGGELSVGIGPWGGASVTLRVPLS